MKEKKYELEYLQSLDVVKNGEYLIFPKKIMLDTNINIMAKAIYLYIETITENGKKKMPSIALISQYLNIEQDTVKKHINALIENGYMEHANTHPSDIKNTVLKNKNTGYECEWCGGKSIALQKHHYPISKSDGGTETVNICPNCHYEFHALEKETRVVR